MIVIYILKIKKSSYDPELYKNSLAQYLEK